MCVSVRASVCAHVYSHLIFNYKQTMRESVCVVCVLWRDSMRLQMRVGARAIRINKHQNRVCAVMQSTAASKQTRYHAKCFKINIASHTRAQPMSIIVYVHTEYETAMRPVRSLHACRRSICIYLALLPPVTKHSAMCAPALAWMCELVFMREHIFVIKCTRRTRESLCIREYRRSGLQSPLASITYLFSRDGPEHIVSLPAVYNAKTEIQCNQIVFPILLNHAAAV